MNLRYQETFCIIFLLCTSITLAEDFDFVPEQNDDVEPIAAEPTKVDSQPKLSKAGVRCLPTESTIQLSLILRVKSWKHVQTSLKQRTISKLAEYFLVPEESIIVRDATSNDLHKMVEKALQHGKKPSRTVGKSLGWIGFPVGCGEKMSSSAKETVRNVNTQLAELRDLTGMDFGWWIIWKEQTGGAAASDKRIKREVDPDDDYYDYDDDEAAEDDDEGETTEVPHAHRHHHGSSEQYSTKAEHHSSPTHATNKHTTNNPDHTVETHHHQQHHHHHQQQHRHHASAEKQAEPWPRGGAATGEHRKSPVMVSVTAPSITAATTQPSQPKRKHNHGLYDQVKERSAKKQAAALLAHTHQSDRAFQPATEPSQVAGHPFTPPDLRESVSQLESTISKTIANNEQLKKDEETLLARKAKHKRIDIERIVETELLLPEIERLQDEVFRDDYVIEDVVRGPKFYDFSTQPQLDRFVPLEPEPEKRQPATSPTTTLPASVNRSPTTVKPQYVTVEKTATPPMPTTSKQVPATTPNSKPRTSPTQAVSILTVPRRHTDESLFTTKLPHPAITPVVSSIDADEDAPSRSDTTTTIGTINPSAQSRLVPPTKLDPTTTTTTTTTLSSTPARSAAKTTTMTTTTATATSTRAKTIPTELIELQTSPATMPLTTTTTTTTASATSTTVSEEPTNPTATTTTTPASSASATNTRSTNLFASVPLVKSDDEPAASSSSTIKTIVPEATTEKSSTISSFSSAVEYSTPSSTTTATATTTIAALPAITSTPASSWHLGMDEDEEASYESKEFFDEIDSKPSTFANPEMASISSSTTTTTHGSEDQGTSDYTTTTVSYVPLTTTTTTQEELSRYATNVDRSPFGRKINDEDITADQEEEDQEEGEDIDEEEEEEDYFSQGVRITVLPPNNLPPLIPRAEEAEVTVPTSTLTPDGVDSDRVPNPTEQTGDLRLPGMASPATTTNAMPTDDSTAITMTSSQYQNTRTTTQPTTNSAYYNIPTTTTTTTVIASATPSIATTNISTSFAATTTTTAASAASASYPSTTLAPEPDTVATSTALELQPTSTQRSVSTFTTPKQDNEEEDKELEYENYDDEYDDEEEGAIELTTQPDPRVLSSTTTTERPMPSSTEPSTTPTTVTMPTTTPSTTTTTTTEAPTTTTTTTTSTTTTTTTTTTEASTTTSTMLTTELDEPTNLPPIIRNRIPKQAIPAGKVFRYQVPLETFHDNEDGNNLSLELLDARDQPLKPSSWIQFNEDTKEIYGLPLEKDVSRWPYKLRATDSGNLTVTEKVDIQVQQHKSHRSLNHEISLALRLNRKFASNVDWHIETARGISVVLGDVTLSNIIVRDIRNSIQDPSLATFVYTNETLPKDRCPEEKLDELVALLTEEALNDALNPDITVKSVQGQQIAQCTKVTPPKVKPTQSIQRNYAPQTRNQVDQVNATVGHLLVFKVPVDTFYDPEDGNELKMKLLTTDRNTLDPNHWLQFDSKNQEFYGVPRTNDIGRKEYLLMAEDREGLTATDALVVVVNPHHKRDYSVLFELTLDISHEQFNTAQVQRRFIERLAQVFGDASTHYIKIHHIRPIHHTGQVQVSFFNTTLSRQHQRCPQEEIETLRNILLHQDSTIRAKVREILGQEFSLQNVSLVPLDNCHGFDTPHHATSEPEKAAPKPISKDDYLLTFVLPSVIIIVMLLIAAIIACILYKRRLTGKMELGTDEERKSFRSKGIPVIFQDELDEKPEIGNKSPVILKDEKPPLLPPSYSSTNHDGDNEDVDEYVPPQPVIVGGRESRGKSPVTPSYRRPPPYVSP